MATDDLFKRLLRGLLCVLALAAGGPVAAEEFFKVTLLGTGSPRPSPDRNGPSTLVEANGLRLLFDMGRNNTVALFKARVPLGSLNAHFITHMHSDHVNGLPDLYLTGWLGVPYADRKQPFVVYGPAGTRAMMDHLYAAFSEDRRIRTEDEHYPLAGITPEAHEFTEAGVVYERDGVKVSAFPVFHGEHIHPAFGYKIEYRGHSVVLSGDTKYAKRVEDEARGADLLVHEVAAIPGDAERVYARYPAYRTIMDHHTDPETAGRLFANAKPKLAVYSHIVLPSDPRNGLQEATTEEILAQTRRSYAGPVVVGRDGLQFVVTERGVEALP
ncbi:MAG: MBL fold metallo-hydrolase [Rubrivivax sp.]